MNLRWPSLTGVRFNRRNVYFIRIPTGLYGIKEIFTRCMRSPVPLPTPSYLRANIHSECQIMWSISVSTEDPGMKPVSYANFPVAQTPSLQEIIIDTGKLVSHVKKRWWLGWSKNAAFFRIGFRFKKSTWWWYGRKSSRTYNPWSETMMTSLVSHISADLRTLRSGRF